MSETWAVTVSVNGEDVLTISHHHYSGIPNIEDHAEIVRQCAENLLAFIGPAKHVEDEG